MAIKSIDVSALDRENLIKLEREVKIVKVIDHPHIVKSYEVSSYCQIPHVIALFSDNEG